MIVTKEWFEDSGYHYAGFYFRFEKGGEAFRVRQYENEKGASFLSYSVQEEEEWVNRTLNAIPYRNTLFRGAVGYLKEEEGLTRITMLLGRDGYVRVNIKKATSEETQVETEGKANRVWNLICLCFPGVVYALLFGVNPNLLPWIFAGALFYVYVWMVPVALLVLLFSRSRAVKLAARRVLLGFLLTIVAQSVVYYCIPPPPPRPGHP